jgi:hypothetical protein
MREKLYLVLGVGVVIGLISIIPTMIRGLFWILLQMMYYPLTSTIIVVNLLMFQFLYIRFTENKTQNK